MARSVVPVVGYVSRLLFACLLLTLVFGTPNTARAADQPEVEARYAVVVDADTGAVLYDKGMDEPAAPASLTKIFTAAVALDSAPLDQRMTVDAYDQVGEASMGISPGEELTMRTLLYGMMLPSGNDAAMTIARNLGELPGDSPQQAVDRFMDRVNRTAERLGLTSTHLVNPHGLDQPGHQTTAHDIAAMTMYALKNPEFRKIIGAPYYSAEGHEMYQVNHMLSNYPGLVGGKTGITDNAGYCLVEVAERDGKTVIAVVLHSTAEAWYEDAKALLDYGFQALAAQPDAASEETITLGSAQPTAVPTVVVAASPEPFLTVDRVADTTAVVRPVDVPPASGGISWRWPVASVVSMGVMLTLIMNYPLLLGIGGLVLHRKRTPQATVRGPLSVRDTLRGRRRRRGAAASRRSAGAVPASPWDRATSPLAQRPSPRTDEHLAPRRATGAAPVVPLNAAETIVARAIRLAQRGEYHAATGEFARALRTDPSVDLTRCSGFWTMQPAGYVAAARAYILVDRPGDARTLATIVQLSFGSNRDLERLMSSLAGSPAYV